MIVYELQILILRHFNPLLFVMYRVPLPYLSENGRTCIFSVSELSCCYYVIAVLTMKIKVYILLLVLIKT